MDRVILFHYLIDMSAGWVARNKIVLCKAGQRANHKNQLEQALMTDYLHVDGGSALEPLPLHQPDQADPAALPVDGVVDPALGQRAARVRVRHVGQQPHRLGLLLPRRQPRQTPVCIISR